MSGDEVARLKALRDLAVLDTAAEAAFDELTRAASLACDVPIALISLVDADRQWFKSRVGLDATETPRGVAFCAHAILRPDEIMEIPDATMDPRFSGNPLVVGEPGIRFYAGAPLVDGAGHAFGTLCVIDRRPRRLTTAQREILSLLARQVMRLLDARSAANRLVSQPREATPEPLRTLIEEVPTGAVLVGDDGRLEVNQEACAIVGYRAEQLPDLDAWFMRLHGEAQGAARRLYEQDRRNGFQQARSTWVRCGDGRRRELECSAVRSPRGELWLVRDVTATAGAEERFRVLFEQSSDAHLIFDEHGIIDCNHAAVTMLRCADKRQVLSVHPAMLSPAWQPDGRRSDEKCIEMDRLARERGHHRFEWLHRRMDGTDFPVEVTLTPVTLSGIPVLLAVWHDLTERKAAEEAERERERRWLLALEAAGDGVWDWDLESSRVFFSPRWKSMLGYREDEIGGTLDEWDRRVHPEDRERTNADIKRHLSGETPQYVNEHRVLCKDGSWKWILDRGMIVDRFADGRPKRMIGTHSDLTERRRMEDTLRLERERFRAMSDASPVGIYVTDVVGRATYLNDRWCQLTGINASDGMGDGWGRALHPDDRERVLAVWSVTVAAGRMFDEEYRYRRPDGSVVWCHGFAAPMHVGGEVVGYVGSVMDITERHEVEERLRDSLHRFDLVVAGAAIGIWETRLDPERWREQFNEQLPFYWSRRFIEIMGYMPEEFPDRLEPWLRALHPDDRERVLMAVMECLEYGVPYNLEYRLRHGTGEYRWYHATGEAERDAHGRPYRMAGSMSDITGRKRDEELLERARTRLVDAIGNIDAGFAMFDRDAKLLICNQSFQQLYGLEVEDVRPGTSHEDILLARIDHGSIDEGVADPLGWMRERLSEHAQQRIDRELRLGGRWIRVSDRRTADGGMVTLHTDVTVLKEAAEEMRKARDLAEHAARAKANFLATMSHELRTPMNGVIGMTSLLLDTPLNEQQREFAETVRVCGDQLLALINDILDFSKIESGNLVLEHIPFSPRKVAEDCIQLLADQAERKGLLLVCLLGAEVPARVVGDPTRLRQVLLNLLGNAVKFTDRGEVVLSLTPAGGEADRPLLDVAVRDTGIGIPEQARERLFKPFTQADSSTTRKYGGTGLGLVISQRLVEFMGGTISLESQPGIGSTFTCRIPFPISVDALQEPGHAGLIGQRVLVVAGSAAGRRSLREQFIGWGMLCDEAPDAATAHALARKNQPALVVIDHDQPGDGLSWARSLLAESTLQGVPSVLILGAAHRGMAAAARSAGFSGFLTRPVRHSQLFDCLLTVLQRSCTLVGHHDREQVPLVTRHSLEEQRPVRRVLVVEDNPVNRQVAVMMLSKLGCRCDVATNGKEAVDALGRNDYQVVFLDCQMPVMDGFTAASEIRRREGVAKHTRIVALTANAMAGDRERCLAAGMDDYVSKPIQAEDLEAVLARADRLALADSSDATPQAGSVDPVLDEDLLRSLMEATDGETVRAVAGMFAADAVTSIREIGVAFRAQDAVAVSRVAHRLKGSSGTLGLRRVQTLCQQIEHAARTRRLETAQPLLSALQRALDEARLALAAHPLVAR
jgi:two-component system, sensor histidine kinase and response regulator